MTLEKATKTPAYIWFDTEFTSLDMNQARLLQVSMLATDISLNRLSSTDHDINLYISLDPSYPVSEWVEQNLSGILTACRSGNAVSLDTADRMLVEALDSIGIPGLETGIKPMLAGNTIHMDLTLAKQFLPRFTTRLHYRMLDVSVLKVIWLDWLDGEVFDKDNVELLQSFLPDNCSLPAGSSHDAYYDIHASLAELRFYREKLGLNKYGTATHNT